MDSQEAFGMAMQISNHPEYLKTIDKYSLASNTDFLTQEIRINGFANTIGAYVIYPGINNELYYENEKCIRSVGAFGLIPGEEKTNPDF